jgi:hypothetical protein
MDSLTVTILSLTPASKLVRNSAELEFSRSIVPTDIATAGVRIASNDRH